MDILSVISFSLFLVELAATKHQLKETQEIAACCTSKADTQIKRPYKVGNVQKAIGFINKPKLWAGFIVSFGIFFSCKAYLN